MRPRRSYLGSQHIQRTEGVVNETSLRIRTAVYARSRGRGLSGENPRNRLDPVRWKGRDIENTFPCPSIISTSGFVTLPGDRATIRARPAMQAVFRHDRRDRRQVHRLVPDGSASGVPGRCLSQRRQRSGKQSTGGLVGVSNVRSEPLCPGCPYPGPPSTPPRLTYIVPPPPARWAPPSCTSRRVGSGPCTLFGNDHQTDNRG